MDWRGWRGKGKDGRAQRFIWKWWCCKLLRSRACICAVSRTSARVAAVVVGVSGSQFECCVVAVGVRGCRSASFNHERARASQWGTAERPEPSRMHELHAHSSFPCASSFSSHISRPTNKTRPYEGGATQTSSIHSACMPCPTLSEYKCYLRLPWLLEHSRHPASVLAPRKATRAPTQPTHGVPLMLRRSQSGIAELLILQDRYE